MGKSKQREKDVLSRLEWSKRHASSKFSKFPFLLFLKEIWKKKKWTKKGNIQGETIWEERERESLLCKILYSLYPEVYDQKVKVI